MKASHQALILDLTENGVGEKAQQLRALAALGEDSCLIPNALIRRLATIWNSSAWPSHTFFRSLRSPIPTCTYLHTSLKVHLLRNLRNERLRMQPLSLHHKGPVFYEIQKISLKTGLELIKDSQEDVDLNLHKMIMKLFCRIILYHCCNSREAYAWWQRLGRGAGRCVWLSSTREAVGGCFLCFHFFYGTEYCINNK